MELLGFFGGGWSLDVDGLLDAALGSRRCNYVLEVLDVRVLSWALGDHYWLGLGGVAWWNLTWV